MSIQNSVAIGYYTKMNSKLLDVISYAARTSDNLEVSRNLSSYNNFLQTKERAGIERAVLATVFIKDSFPPGMLKKFITLVSEQHTYLSVFRSMADPLDIQLYESKMQASVVKEAENFRRIAMDKSISGGFGIDPAVWFQKQTGKINILKQVEDEIALGVLTKSDALSKTADEVLIYSTLATIIILTIAIFLAYVITTDFDC